MKRILCVSIIVLCIGLVSCSQAKGDTIQLENGDLQQRTASASELPSFLHDKDDTMQNIYLAAAKHQELLEQIPCYCGCGESAGHEHNYHCFIGEVRDDYVMWDDHSTRCPVCLETAAQSIIMTQEGKSIKEVRTFIDETYNEGYAAPTPTPGI